MHKRGSQDSQAFTFPALYEPPSEKGPVFAGKPYLQQNTVMQRSIMEIFDEFTEIISGELKTLSQKEFEQERKSGQQ